MYNAQHVRKHVSSRKSGHQSLHHIIFLPSCKTLGLHTFRTMILDDIGARKKITFEARGACFFLAVEHAEYCLEPDTRTNRD